MLKKEGAIIRITKPSTPELRYLCFGDGAQKADIGAYRDGQRAEVKHVLAVGFADEKDAAL